MRVADAVAEAIKVLEEGRVASARVDAELLAAHVLGIARGSLATADDLAAAQLDWYRDLVRERAARVPLQHLTGLAPFRHRELLVGRGVFVPRPETERLVEWGLGWLRDHHKAGETRQPGAAPIVVDLCAGSGAIAVSIATEAPGTRVYAVERDAAALGWLRRNVDQLGVPTVTVVDGDAGDPAIMANLNGQVDLVLGNPPYVPEVGAAGLPPEVVEHDPHDAVFAGVDGLAVIRPVIGRAAALLRDGGGFGVEHDDTHAYVVPTLVHSDGGFEEVTLHHDLARRPRFTTATRRRRADGVADLRS